MPSPTTASFIWLGEYSPTASPISAQATSAAPRAWPVAKAAVTLLPNHTVSMPTQSGTEPLDHGSHLMVYLQQPLGQGHIGLRGHAPVGHAGQPRPALLHHAPARVG